MPIEGSKSISLWSGHAKAIEEYAKTRDYPPTTPVMIKKAVSMKAIQVRKLLASPSVKNALLAISEGDEDEERVILKSITVPDKVAKALVDRVNHVKNEITSAFVTSSLQKEPSPTYCAGVWILLFIETESPGFLSKYKKKELVAVG